MLNLVNFNEWETVVGFQKRWKNLFIFKEKEVCCIISHNVLAPYCLHLEKKFFGKHISGNMVVCIQLVDKLVDNSHKKMDGWSE